MTLFYDTFSTPLGAFSVAVDAAGAVCATAFGDLDRLRTRLRRCGAAGTGRARSRRRTAVPASAPALVRDAGRLAQVRAQFEAYFQGKRSTLRLPVAPAGSAFQRRVWSALQRIPFGATRTYGELAAELGRPRAARAVGAANAANPCCVVVPCHRVIGADAALRGFAFGEEVKRRLLALEGVDVTSPRDLRRR